MIGFLILMIGPSLSATGSDENWPSVCQVETEVSVLVSLEKTVNDQSGRKENNTNHLGQNKIGTEN